MTLRMRAVEDADRSWWPPAVVEGTIGGVGRVGTSGDRRKGGREHAETQANVRPFARCRVVRLSRA
jgi:hypothetical protein